MIFLVISLLFGSIRALPLYGGTSLSLEHLYPALQHHTQASAFLGQPLTMFYKYGNLEELGALSKSLLASHMAGQKIKSPPLPVIHSNPLLLSPQIHHTLLIFPIGGMKEMELEKSIAGALIKQIPKVSKLPISVTPKSEVSSIAQAGALGGSLLATPILASKALLGGFGIPYEF